MVDQTRKKIIEGSTLSVGVVLVLALFALVNYLSLRHYDRFDWTENSLYSLSEKSRNVVADLDREIELVIFMSPGSQLYNPADELLTSYEAANTKFIDKRVIDPVKNRFEAQRLLDRHSIERSNVIVVASGEERRVIDEIDLAEFDYSGAQFGQGATLKEFKGEQLITSAILELVEAEKPKILFTTGHGETPLDGGGGRRSFSIAKRLLGNDNFGFEEWSTATATQVPETTDLVVVAAPTTSFFPAELDLFSRYLDGGGRMLVFLDPSGTDDLTVDAGLAQWLAGYGVAAGDDVVVDPESQMPLMGPGDIIPASYGVHPIVEYLDQSRTAVHLSFSRSIRKADDASGDLEITELLETSASAWGETDPEDPALEPGDGEVHGPVAVGVAVSFQVETGGEEDLAAEEPAAVTEEAETEVAESAGEDQNEKPAPPEARLVVYGDVDFAADTAIQSTANSELVMNTFNWLVEREQLIAIEGRSTEETRLFLTQPELLTIWGMVLLLLPGIAVVTGVTVFMRRRR